MTAAAEIRDRLLVAVRQAERRLRDADMARHEFEIELANAEGALRGFDLAREAEANPVPVPEPRRERRDIAALVRGILETSAVPMTVPQIMDLLPGVRRSAILAALLRRPEIVVVQRGKDDMGTTWATSKPADLLRQEAAGG